MSSAPPSTPPQRADAPPRPPLVKHPGRLAIVVGTVAVVITLLVWATQTSETDTGPTRDAATLPSAIESLTPGPGELARPQDTIIVDLRDDLTGVLQIDPPDGAPFEVPEDQTERVVPLGQLSFRTGPDQELTRFAPGGYRLTVLYWPQSKPRPDQPTGFVWEFRTGA